MEISHHCDQDSLSFFEQAYLLGLRHQNWTRPFQEIDLFLYLLLLQYRGKKFPSTSTTPDKETFPFLKCLYSSHLPSFLTLA